MDTHCDEPFPINRRHQGLATSEHGETSGEVVVGFQSIGVTKDWRQSEELNNVEKLIQFPINRRHQGLATCNTARAFVRALHNVSNQ